MKSMTNETPNLKVVLSCINDAGINMLMEMHCIHSVEEEFPDLAEAFVEKNKNYMLDNGYRSWVSVDYCDGRDHDHHSMNEEVRADVYLHSLTTGTPYDGWEN